MAMDHNISVRLEPRSQTIRKTRQKRLVKTKKALKQQLMVHSKATASTKKNNSAILCSTKEE